MTDDDLLGEGPTALRRARALVRDRMAATVSDDDLDTLVLLTSEVVANATLHVGGPVRLTLRSVGDGLRVEVRDSSARLPQRRRLLDADRVSGRGLHLVAQLARTWGADVEPTGKVVWFEVAV